MERKRIRKYILLLLLVICAVPLIAHFVRAWRIGDICNNITIILEDDEQMSIHPFYANGGFAIVLPFNSNSLSMKVMYKEDSLNYEHIDNRIAIDLGRRLLRYSHIDVQEYFTEAPSLYISTVSGSMKDVDKSIDKSYKEGGQFY